MAEDEDDSSSSGEMVLSEIRLRHIVDGQGGSVTGFKVINHMSPDEKVPLFDLLGMLEMAKTTAWDYAQGRLDREED